MIENLQERIDDQLMSMKMKNKRSTGYTYDEYHTWDEVGCTFSWIDGRWNVIALGDYYQVIVITLFPSYLQKYSKW